VLARKRSERERTRDQVTIKEMQEEGT